jgi:CheY-like chemotaxis protein
VTILVAEDDPDDRKLMKEAFTESPARHDLRFVADGEELMDYLLRRGQYADPASSPRPGLLLLDLNMPKKDGRTALQEIKADPRFGRCAVVVLNHLARGGGHRPHVCAVGRLYIAKPVTFEALIEVVKTWASIGLRSWSWPEHAERPA